MEGAQGGRGRAQGNPSRQQWQAVIPFFNFSPGVRKIIYTTNAIESLHDRVRKAMRNREHFPGDEAAGKALYLALMRNERKWQNVISGWHDAKMQPAIQSGERFRIED